MEIKLAHTYARTGGIAAIAGALIMFAGAILWASTGTDMDHALHTGEMENYLAAAAAHRSTLVANLCLWIAGVAVLGVAGIAMASLGHLRPLASRIASYWYLLAVPIAIVSFVAWLAVVVRIAPDSSDAAVNVATAMGWFASTADWIATVLILAAGPVTICHAGRPNWTPNWLAIWSYLSLAAGLLTTVAMLTGGLSTYGFLIVPIGLGWMIAAGVVLLRNAASA